MSELTHLIDLASERLGGRTLAANDDFFAPKENLLKRDAPIFIPDKYTDRGKWMDGWESRRRRTPGHDWCIVQLGVPGILRTVVVDTAFFRGNYPSHCSLDACAAASGTAPDELPNDRAQWATVLAKSELRGDTLNVFAVSDPRRFTHLRLNIYPDGGLARLRTMGEVVPDWRRVFSAGGEVDLASIVNGAHVLDTSDRFFGEPHNMLMPDRAPNMGDGWETKRRRGPGYDWAVVRLGVEGTIRRVEIDTAHYKGNYPESCSVEAAVVPELADSPPGPDVVWTRVLPRTLLQPDHRHLYERELAPNVSATHLRLNIYPDGGISRLRVWGEPTRDGRRRAMLQLLNAMDEHEARATLKDCCAAPEWVARMAAARPFRTPDAAFSASDAASDALSREEWLEALRHHPRIGEQRAEAGQSATAAAWSAGEQAGVGRASPLDRSAMADLNRAYEARFGYVFIVCATGRTVEDIAALLQQRLSNDPEAEIRIAAAEHRRITQLRLEKLLLT
jgi:allantoicase